MACAAGVVTGCGGDRTPSIKGVTVDRREGCSTPLMVPAVDFTEGPVTMSGRVRWNGSLLGGTVKNALEPLSVRERFVVPEGEELERLRTDIADRIMGTFRQRESTYSLKVPVRAQWGVFEPRCAYRVELSYDGRAFTIDVQAGSGELVNGLANDGGGYAGPTP
ncbi:hypothetical protein AXK60_01505 [Tsukamurella pseudospumae]|uniref:Uncharacterized protein n=2 Tax=Tsukamurella pseudospumae TaxID=239498 RepID=A0A138AVZ1_9ACTN|nr:hypothetical protein AXK60_01505 [Tsukamurella pseudospumae]